MSLQLEAHRAALEKLVLDQSKQVQAQQREVLEKVQEQRELLAATQEVSPVTRQSRAQEIVSRAFSKESINSTERLSAAMNEILNRLEQQYSATEGLHDQVRSLIEGEAERHVADRLEVLYARHESRLENLFAQNERSLEDWRGQLRMVQRATATEDKERVSRRTLPSEHMPLKPSSKESTVHAEGEGRFRSLGMLRGRHHDVPLDIAALSAVQGWRALSRSSPSSRSSPRLRDKSPQANVGGNYLWARLREGMSEATLESLSALLVVCNLIFMGIDAQVSLAASVAGEPAPAWLMGGTVFFLAMLILEVFARMSLEGWRFLLGVHWAWNVFDCVVVVFQVMDTILVLYNLNFLRTLRVIRAARTTRAVRTMKSVRELRVMISSIGNSLVPLLWAFVLLFMALYAVSLILMQSLVAHVESKGPDQVNKNLLKFYGSMDVSMVSLFKAVSGGQLWGDILEPLEEISSIYIVAFLVFITFTVFGMLNVLTAIFVDSTSKMSASDHDLVIKEHLDAKNSTATQLRKLLLEADTQHSGFVNRREFESKLSDPHFAAHLSVLELDIFEAQGLFNILRPEDAQGVPIEEFIYGLMRMKGNAKGVDMVTMLSENRRILATLLAFMEFMDDTMLDVRSALRIPGDICLQEYLDAA